MDLTTARPSILRRLTRRATPLGALSASALIAVGSLVPSLQQCTPPSQQQQVVDITNQRRAESGRPAVRVEQRAEHAPPNGTRSGRRATPR